MGDSTYLIDLGDGKSTLLTVFEKYQNTLCFSFDTSGEVAAESTLLSAEKFRVAAGHYIRPFLSKGIPSLFSDLSPLYDHPGKADILEKLFLEVEHSIKTTGVFPGSVDKEPPPTLLWTLFYLSQHYDRRGLYDIALKKIDEAIEHTPTVIDLYLVKLRKICSSDEI